MSSLSNKNEPQSLPPGESAPSGVQDNVNTHFDATVSYWDEVYGDETLQGVIYQQRQAAALEYVDAADLPTPAHVLEIGCGAGHLTVRLAERNRPGQGVSHLHSPRRIDRFVREAGLQATATRTIGFGPLSLLGHRLLRDHLAIRLNKRLQTLADAGVPGLRRTGWHYLVLA